jgi:RNA polymerase sigma-70 factor, ECF subfamily
LKTRQKKGDIFILFRCLTNRSRYMAIHIEEYYRTYGPMVLRRCRQLLKDEPEALDALQETFMQVIRKQDTLTDQYPSSLLYTMATNISLNMIRSRKRRPEAGGKDEILDQIAVFDENIENLEAGSVLDKIFRREQPSTRVIAVLHYVDGLTLEETAKEVNLSVSGVRKRLRLLQDRIKTIKEQER